jgi:hypothetical protein
MSADGADVPAAVDRWRWWQAGRGRTGCKGRDAAGWRVAVAWVPFLGAYLATVAMPGSDDFWPVARGADMAAQQAAAVRCAAAAAAQLLAVTTGNDGA